MSRRNGSKERIRRFLLANIGRIVDTAELREAAGLVGEYGRRLRELRDEEGWPILSHRDRKVLKPGQYLLRKAPPAKRKVSFARRTSAKMRAEVLNRDGFTCQMCGSTADDIDESTGRIVRLQVCHVPVQGCRRKGGVANLRTICSTCNRGAQLIIAEKRSRKWLLSQIQQASFDDQLAAYDRLRNTLGV